MKSTKNIPPKLARLFWTWQRLLYISSCKRNRRWEFFQVAIKRQWIFQKSVKNEFFGPDFCQLPIGFYPITIHRAARHWACGLVGGRISWLAHAPFRGGGDITHTYFVLNAKIYRPWICLVILISIVKIVLLIKVYQ